MGLWEAGGTYFHVAKRYTLDYSPFHPGLPFQEAAIAAAIYHPEHGNGERNAEGRLVVTYNGEIQGLQKDKPHRPISYNWFNAKKNLPGGASMYTEEGRETHSPREWLLEGGAPHLVESGLLTPDDFRATGESEVSEKYGLRQRLDNPKGYVTLNEKIRYLLGVQFGKKEGSDKEVYEAHSITPDLGGLVRVGDDGKKELTHVFTLLHPGDQRLKPVYQKGKLSYYSAGIRDGAVQIREYQRENKNIFLSQHADESTEQYQERQAAFDFNAFLNRKEEFVRATGISLEALSPLERAALLDFYQATDADKAGKKRKTELYQFAKVYKERGLKIFLSVESDREAGSAVLALAHTLRPGQMENVIDAYNACAEEATTRVNALCAELGIDESSRQAQRVLFDGLMLRAKDLLTNMAGRLDVNEDVEDVVNEGLTALKNESALEQAEAGLFAKIAGLFKEKEQSNLDLTRFIAHQETLIAMFEETGNRGALLRILGAR